MKFLKKRVSFLVTTGTLAALPSALQAQAPDSVQIEFNKAEQSVVRHRKDAKILQFAIKADWLAKDTEYAISVSEGDGTTLSGADFTIEVPHSTINGKDGKQERNFFVTIEPDTLPDRDRKLVLELAVKNQKDGAKAPNKGAVRKLTITVKQASPELADYNYLAYVGTNFDLVDGPQARNLFFATNLFIPRSTDSRKGIFLSLYGNRAISSIDSSSNVPWRTGLNPTSDTTYEAYFANADRVTTFSSDNLGAYFSPFFGMGRLSDKDNGVQYHFTPAAEFVWRRITRSTEYTNVIPSDTSTFSGSLANGFTTPTEYTVKENRFEFKIAPGFFVSHDTPKISMHLYFNIGYNALFIPQGLPSGIAGEYEYKTQHDAFISARAWITEPNTGVTLQAEVMNTWVEKRPYYVVTLSKALSFKNIGSIFQPITAR